MEAITNAALALVRAQDRLERAKDNVMQPGTPESACAELRAMQRAVAKVQGIFADLRNDPTLRPVYRELRVADAAAFRLGDQARRALAILEDE